MNAPFQVRQLAQYNRADAAIPGSVALLQMGEAGAPYASILAGDLVASALAAGGRFGLNAASGAIVFGSDQGSNAGVISMASGEFLFSAPVRASQVNATFVNAQSLIQAGIPVATQADLAAVVAQSVTSFNLRTGDIMLMPEDILRAGGAPIRDAHFGGWITAPSVWDSRANDDTVATTNWVHRAIHDTGVSSFNGRTGCVTLTVADINAATAAGPGYPTAPSPVLGDASNRIATTLFVDESLQDLHLTISNEQLALLTSTYAPINSPQLTGIPTAPTANPGTSTGQLATTSFVMHAITASTTGVSSFNTRTGAVVLNTGDITSAGGAVLASPAFSGNPTAPTAAPGTSNTQLATTAFVAAAVGVAGGVTSFNTRTGAVVLTAADVSGSGVLANTPLTGVPTAPTAAPGTSTTQLATTAFVAASAAAGVTSFMSRTGAVTLTAADVSAAGGALNASPTFTGTPTAPTPVTADSSTTLATTAFVHAAITAGASGVTTFNGRAGAVTLTTADITGAGGAPLASPTFTGTPAAPTVASTDSSTTLATTAFVHSVLTTGPLSVPGWTFSLVGGNQSTIAATGSNGFSSLKLSGSVPQALFLSNSAGGVILEMQDATSTQGSVDYIILKNSSFGSSPIVTVAGGDTNIGIQLVPKGTGTVQAPTMTAGDNSTAVATTAFVHGAVSAPILRSYLAGLTLSTAGASATFSVAAGVAADGQNLLMITLGSAMSKTTAAWAAGTGNGSLDTGAIANSTWYHVYLIYNSSTQATDIAISLSASAPTYPSGYSYSRRIGSILTNASAQWVLFSQLGDEFLWSIPTHEVNVTTLGTASTLFTVNVPTGVQVVARMRVSGSNATVPNQILVTSPDESIQACGTPASNNTMSMLVAGGLFATMDVRTSTSGQIRAVASAASTSFNVNTYGWRDRRGRDA